MVLFHVARKGGFLSFWAHRCSVTARRQFYVVASTLWCGKQNAIVTASGRLAQLVRALPSHGRGHWFESSIAHTLTRHPSGRAGNNSLDQGDRGRELWGYRARYWS